MQFTESALADWYRFCPYRTQDFEKAGSLRDREMELKTQIQAITGAAKEESAAEAEAEGSGPLVTDQDIANIVAQWTGIPVEKARRLHPWHSISPAPRSAAQSTVTVHCLEGLVA